MSDHRAPLLFAACLLVIAVAASPMAVAEDSPAAAKNGPYRVELPDGASVELVGVGENGARDRGWWRPDGSILPTSPGGGVAQMTDLTNSMLRTFAVWIVTDGKAQVRGPLPLGSAGQWSAYGETYQKEQLGAQVVEKRRTVAAMAPSGHISLVIHYAGGPWKTLTTVTKQGTGVFTGVKQDVRLGVVWDNASDENGAVRISAAYHVDEPLVRIVAVDERNQEHESELRPGGVANDVRLESARFPGLPIARVKEFRFQTRPYNHEIEFRHVSLHAGQKTPVQMYLDGFRYLPKATGANERHKSSDVASVSKAATPQKATDAEVLQRILANWRARQERTKSFRYAWNTRYEVEGTRRTHVHELRRALWVAGDDRFRLERAVIRGPEYWRAKNAQDVRAFDGTTHFVLEWLRSPTDTPLGAIRPHKEMQDFDDLECDPLYLTFRPFHPLFGWGEAGKSEFRIVARDELVDGRHCIKLEQTLGHKKQRCWVDPDRDDLIVCLERERGMRTVWRFAISYRATPQFGWIPERWTCRDPYDNDRELRCEATTSAVNEPLPADAFRIDFPPGALVFDLPSRKQFVIAADGSRAPAPPFDSVSSPEFRKALDTVEPFTIEAEPIKDAIDFLQIAKKIPIDLDGPAFRKAGLDIDVECQCDIKEMTLREQLRWLSGAVPQPTRLIEKYGQILLTPAASSKPAKE